ncbi:hypothetical protein U1Q18_040388 [Sarracenia purpurea var. burkii]
MTIAMVFSLSTTPSVFTMLSPKFRPSFPSISITNPKIFRLDLCRAAKQQSGPVKKLPANKRKRKKVGGGGGSDESRGLSLEDVEIADDGDGFGADAGMNEDGRPLQRYQPLPLPKPPAGFVVDEQGRVVMVSNKRIATIVDSTSNFPLECIIRRVFKSPCGDECMLLCPVDTPVQILKSTNIEGWSAVCLLLHF